MSRCDICMSDDNTGVACEDCSFDYGPELDALRAEVKRLREAVAFARSVIKCGEPWSDTCEQVIITVPKDGGK